MKNFVFLSLLLGMALFAPSAQAIFDYADVFIPQWAAADTAQINSHLEAIRSAPRSCDNIYQKIADQGTMDIHYSMGYFDYSEGHPITWNGNDYGYSPSLDIETYNFLHAYLQRPCTGRLRFCGFREIENGEGKTVMVKKIQLLGKSVDVKFTMTHASASESYVRNTGELQSLQKRLTAQSEENFFGQLAKADVVVYNGHSRLGGGPDFNPPILTKGMETDYHGYYLVQHPGLKKMLAALQAGPNKEFFMGLISCSSYEKFYTTLHTQDPNLRMALTTDLIYYDDSFAATLGYMEGLMQGLCGEEMSTVAKPTRKLVNGFKIYNI